MDNGQWTMDNGQWNKKQRNNKQWEWDNKTKESNLKGTMEGLEIWYVTIQRSKYSASCTLPFNTPINYLLSGNFLLTELILHLTSLRLLKMRMTLSMIREKSFGEPLKSLTKVKLTQETHSTSLAIFSYSVIYQILSISFLYSCLVSRTLYSLSLYAFGLSSLILIRTDSLLY